MPQQAASDLLLWALDCSSAQFNRDKAWGRAQDWGSNWCSCSRSLGNYNSRRDTGRDNHSSSSRDTAMGTDRDNRNR